MGIQNRDYMKRDSDDHDERSSLSDSSAEEFLSRFLQRHPRFFLHVSIGLGILVVIALIVAKFSGASH